MLYWLLYPLKDHFSFFNLFRYITFRTSMAAVTSLLIAFVVGPYLIRKIRDHQIQETIRTDGPQGHLKKQGTPTMGGLIVLLSALLPTLLFARLDSADVLIVLLVTLWMGAVGFVDDYLKVIKKMKKGLIARYKMIAQITLGLLCAYLMLRFTGRGAALTDLLTQAPRIFPNPEAAGYALPATATTLPFFKGLSLDWGFLFVPVVVFVITYISNAVNLTDGLDGLAIGLSAIAFAAFAGMSYFTGHARFADYLMIPYMEGAGELTIFCGAMVGACLGFLWFNANPAAIFMGDVGSLPLGAALAAVALLIKKELLLLSVGAVFIGEALSVIIQVAYFKWTRRKYGEGRRFFRMAPLHHHFELSGWPETRIVTRFWILGILFTLLSLSTFKLR